MLKSPALFARSLLRWYDRHRRDLPWRLRPDAGPEERLDPYHVLVSETMLQQTQVATVIPYYHRFLSRFPTLRDLAEADEQDVLRLWQGLGYYSRARHLRAAARKVLDDYGGQIPADPEELLSLPGVGRYTAGAVASIAFDRRAPLVDGNVARVLCRVDALEGDVRDRGVNERLWERAEQILPGRRVGDFNSALMELGATVCTPRRPQCPVCPVRGHCQAYASGRQEQIPPPRPAKPTPLLRRWVLCIRRGERWLIEQRPPKGRWAGLWQFVTIVPEERAVSVGTVRAHLGLCADRPRLIGRVEHALSHRRYEFEAYACRGQGPLKSNADARARVWVRLEELDRYPLSRPQLAVAALLAGKQ